ncbi:restriction endonuclease subunit S [Acinetobacter variabilis]
MAVPKLRFKEFDGDWSEKIISDIADVRGGKRLPKGYSLVESDTGYPYITVTDMEDGTVNCDKIRYVPLDAVDQIKRYRITVDDIYISVAGTLGLVGIIPHELNNANLTENADKLTNIKCDQKYLLQYLNNGSLSQLIDSVSTVGAQPKLALYAIQGMSIFLPANPEQTKIASFLSAVDEKISQLTQKHELLSQYKQGMMQKLFSQQIRFKANDGSEFGEWEEKPLIEITSKASGKNKDGSVTEVLTNSATKGIIKQSDYFDREIVTESNLNGYYIVNIDDFVYNPRISVHAPVGPIKRNKQCLGVMSPLYTVFKITQGNLTYLEYFFDSNFWHDYVKSVANSGARHDRMNITNKDFFDMPVLYPSLEEQTKIANFLSAIDQKIEVVAQQIEQAKQWKKGLLQQMFV